MIRHGRVAWGVCASVAAFVSALAAGEAGAGFVWPTPNDAFQRREPIAAYAQPTVSGDPRSGLFGCVRNDGERFHEGLDLSTTRRDARGEAADPVYAAMAGRVVHINRTAGHSSYGRYLVLLHERREPAFYSLYAHLAAVAPGIEEGAWAKAGATLGRIGRSAAGYSIPRSRAHLHFELGLMLSRDFQRWYDRQNFASKNRHGLWNGMNLVGIDPLDFLRAVRDGRVETFRRYLGRRPVTAHLRVYTRSAPSFPRDHPSLVTRPFERRAVVAWDVGFTAYGVPKIWTPLYADEVEARREGDVRIIDHASSVGARAACRAMLRRDRGEPTLSSLGRKTLEKLFGFR